MRYELLHAGGLLCSCSSLADIEALRSMGLVPDGATIVAVPDDDDVRLEYERRLFDILGARDLSHAAFIRADDEAELRELRAVTPRGPVEDARIAELEASSREISALINAYNAIPSAIPADFAADALWTGSN